MTPAIVAASPFVNSSICLAIYAKFAASSISFICVNNPAFPAFSNNPLFVNEFIAIPC